MTAPDRIYLDYNATAPLRACAMEAMAGAARRPLGNPSSPHQEGRAAHALLDRARGQVAALMGVAQERVAFTSGGTEAVNAMMRGAVEAARLEGESRLAITATDHACVRETAFGLAETGCQIDVVPVWQDGRLDLAALRGVLSGSPAAFVTHWANNETGVVQDLTGIATLCAEHGVPLLVDAVQALGKLPLQMESLGIAAMAVSGHKIGGPAGVGALALDPALPWAPYLRGGHQEYDRRAGTEPVLAAVGFGAAAAEALNDLPTYDTHVATVAEQLRASMRTCGRRVVEHARDAPRLPNTLNVQFDGCDAEALVQRLDLEGVAIGIGAACASGAAEPSPVLIAMGIGEDAARESVRFSLGIDTTGEAVERAAAILRRVLDEWSA